MISLIKLTGVKHFEELLVDGTGFTDAEKQNAINKAIDKIDDVINDMKF